VSRLIYFGIVTSLDDPDALGRIKVKFPAFTEEIESGWLRMVHPVASGEFGHFFLPEVGDEVIVLRGGGDDFNSMVVLGSVYNGNNKPPNTDITGNKLETSQILTRTGHELTFAEASGGESITLKTGDGKYSLVLDQAGELNIDSDQKVNITGGGDVTIDAGSLANVAITAAAVSIEAATGAIDIKTSVGAINIESTTGVTVKGNAPVTVESTAILNLKGSMVNIG
jgi:uncharacterized protein involved in type VI secretion and phage assembly